MLGPSRLQSGNFLALVRQTSVCRGWKEGAVVETCDKLKCCRTAAEHMHL